MRKNLLPIALVAASTFPLAAQGISDATAIAGPQFVSYKFGTGGTAQTVSELAIPFALIVPMGDRFSIDVSSAYANVEVKTGGAQTSSINGLTDTQLRANYTVGDNLAVFTLGVNLPTGQYTVPAAQQQAAGQIGNDFILYPISSMGIGLAATGGVGFAQPLGSWNLGVGGSFRHSTAFDAYQVATSVLRFTPGDEYRLRVGLDRPVGDGRFAVGVTYSKFGSDAADSTTFATGDRALVQASYATPVGDGSRDLQLSVWDLYRAQGQLIGGIAPWENVSNVNVAYGWTAGDVYVQPSAEGRIWNVGGVHAGTLGTFGLRLRFNLGPLSVNPSAAYAVGTLNAVSGGTSTDVTGFKGSLLIRIH